MDALVKPVTLAPLVHVDFHELEWRYALYGGIVRKHFHIQRGSTEKVGADPKKTWDNVIVGAIAEYAVAKKAGTYWNPAPGNTDEPDVYIRGIGCQVRSKSKEDQRLVVWQNAKDEEPYISVWLQPEIKRATLCGWVYGGEAKRKEWLFSYPRPDGRTDLPPKPPMYYVPRELPYRPMDDLLNGTADSFR